MAFRDYPLLPSDVSTIGDATYVGPNMARNDVRPALQQIASDGRELADDVTVLQNTVSTQLSTVAGHAATATLSAALAAASARLFVSTAAGLAASAEGEYFSVPQPASDVFTILYRKQSGAATEINRYPSAIWVTAQLALLKITLSPMQFGAVGDGVTDDGDALNDAADAARAILNANGFAAVEITGGNRLYRTTQSINLTGLQAWNLTVSNLYVFGSCTGKAVFDLIATRGYTFESVGVWGDKANRPAVAFQAQRGSPTGFCDNASFRECFTDGWFSRAAVHDYGQETTQWDHCTIYNRDHTARVAIHEGYSAHAMTSDYAATMTGGTSCVNKQFQNCDYRYLPTDENIASITGISNAASAVVTAAGHPYQIGDEVVFQYVAGMAVLPFVIATVTSRTTNTFTINLDTTSAGTYSGGGYAVRRAEQSPVYIARTEGFAMHDCYVVSYGQPHIEVAFPDPEFQRVEVIAFERILFEGVGTHSVVQFVKTGAVQVQGFTLTTYNAAPAHYFLSSQGAGVVSLFAPRIESYDTGNEAPLLDVPANFAAYGASIAYSQLTLVDPPGFAAFNGTVLALNTADYVTYSGLGYGLISAFGVVATGSATPTFGTNKPGTYSGPPDTWEIKTIGNVDYASPLWRVNT